MTRRLRVGRVPAVPGSILEMGQFTDSACVFEGQTPAPKA
jgi:hypothetical protein